MPVVGLATRNPENSLLEAGAALLIKDYEDPKLWAALEEIDREEAKLKKGSAWYDMMMNNSLTRFIANQIWLEHISGPSYVAAVTASNHRESSSGYFLDSSLVYYFFLLDETETK